MRVSLNEIIHRDDDDNDDDVMTTTMMTTTMMRMMITLGLVLSETVIERSSTCIWTDTIL